jgi:hypothetical protein
MSTTNQYVIRERSDIIPIKLNIPTSMKINSYEGEYSLKQNFFDPTKYSPPNEFLIKLQMRMNKYYIDNKDDNLAIK